MSLIGDVSGLGAVFDFGSKLLDKFFPDPAQKAAAALELEKMHQTGELAKLAAETDLMKGQLAINQSEAQSTNWLVAGARPAILWVCGFALAYAAILEPFARFIAAVIYHYNGAFPVIDTTLTMQILLGLLGLGGMRSWEKSKGVVGSH